MIETSIKHVQDRNQDLVDLLIDISLIMSRADIEYRYSSTKDSMRQDVFDELVRAKESLHNALHKHMSKLIGIKDDVS